MAAGVFVVNFVFAGRFGDYFAAQLAEAQPSALLHYWSLAVEEQFYLLWPLAPRCPDAAPAPVPPTVDRHDSGGRRCVTDHLDLDDRAPADVGVLPPPVADGRAARRCGDRRCRSGVPRRQRRSASSAGVVRCARDLCRRADLRRGHGVPGLHDPVARPGDRARHRRRRAGRIDARSGGRAAPSGGPVGRPALVRDLSVALAGARAVRGRVRAASRCRPGSCSSPSPSACRRCRCVWSRIPCAIRRGWPSGRFAGSPSARMLSPRRCLPGRGCAAPTRRSTRASWPPRRRSPCSRPSLPQTHGGDAAVCPADDAAPRANELVALPDGDVRCALAANRAVLEQGLAQTDVPSNLRPALPRRRRRSRRGLQRRLRRRRTGERSSTPAATAPTDAAFTVVLYGDSHAAQWFPALEAIAEERQFELS